MKHSIFLTVYALMLFSCGQGEEKTTGQQTGTSTSEAVDSTPVKPVDTIAPVEQLIVLNDIPKTKEVNELLKYMIEKYAVNYKEIKADELRVHVLDRFGSDKKYKVYLEKKIPVTYKKEEVLPVAEIRAYVYKDSAQCANALNNWLSCFGNGCEMVQPGQDVKVSSSPGLYIINEKNIICLDHKPEHEANNWKNVHADLKKLFLSKRSKAIEVDAKGELVWIQ